MSFVYLVRRQYGKHPQLPEHLMSTATRQSIPIDVVHLLPELDGMLLSLLGSLTREQWELPTIARQWRVKDVAAHLLDGNIRALSMLRDGYAGEKADIRSYQDLLSFLNGLNADWVKAMKRVSPEMLILLHKITGPLYSQYCASLDPFAAAAFPVAWAGERESRNWMHIAREYTEKFLHQQQIRDAVGDSSLLTAQYHHPFMHIFMQALPYTYRDTEAAPGTGIAITVEGTGGGTWFLLRTRATWELVPTLETEPEAQLFIPVTDAWKLFSKSVSAAEIRDRMRIQGSEQLLAPALQMVSVMA